MFQYLKAGLKGVGQVMLQDHALTGMLFLSGIFWGSVIMGLSALLALLSGFLTACIFRLDKDNLQKGLYGFSAVLVGVAVMLFFKPVWMSWGLVVIGSAAATLLQHFFIKRSFPAFTFPFVAVTWVLLALVGKDMWLPVVDTTNPIFVSFNWLLVPFKSFGQVIFQDKALSGFLFFAGVLVSAPVAAVYGFAAAIVSSVAAYFLGAPVDAVVAGLYGFNAVLCAIVFSGKQWQDALWVLVSVAVSLGITFLFFAWGLPQLTFPFVLATWVTMGVRTGAPSLIKRATLVL